MSMVPRQDSEPLATSVSRLIVVRQARRAPFFDRYLELRAWTSVI